jgi:uncharacterized protein YecE (DUF72 family)
VEVNSTFYHAPSAKALEHWLAQTPGDFRFSCKMPKEITHVANLRDCEAQTKAFLEAMEPLRPKLGCVLIQLPHTFTPGKDERTLKSFLATLPPSFRFAVEFRHPDWHLPRIVHYLEDHGICWAWNDLTTVHDQGRGAFEPLPQTTAKFLYVRLMGDLETKYDGEGERIHKYGTLMWPRDSSLENWAIKIQKHAETTEQIFVSVSNHFEGSAVLTAQRIGRLLHVPIELPGPPEPPAAAATQMKLL